jgi:hypothetical protein
MIAHLTSSIGIMISQSPSVHVTILIPMLIKGQRANYRNFELITMQGTQRTSHGSKISDYSYHVSLHKHVSKYDGAKMSLDEPFERALHELHTHVFDVDC